MYGSTFEIQPPAHWNLIDSTMAAEQPVLSPSSILPLPSSHYACIRARKKYGALYKNVITLFLNVLELCTFKLRNLKLRRSESVCI